MNELISCQFQSSMDMDTQNKHKLKQKRSGMCFDSHWEGAYLCLSQSMKENRKQIRDIEINQIIYLDWPEPPELQCLWSVHWLKLGCQKSGPQLRLQPVWPSSAAEEDSHLLRMQTEIIFKRQPHLCSCIKFKRECFGVGCFGEKKKEALQLFKSVYIFKSCVIKTSYFSCLKIYGSKSKWTFHKVITLVYNAVLLSSMQSSCRARALH